MSPISNTARPSRFGNGRPTGRSAASRWAVGGVGLLGTFVLLATAAADEVQFNRDIRPILWENCFSCHGPDSASREADLRLDQREAAVLSEAIVPGQPDESELIRRIFSDDEFEVMPPPDSHKKLTADQTDLLRRWVAQGAEYQPHWAFIAPQRPEPPQVTDPTWARNPIDKFVLAELDKAGLQPAAEADRRTLARRVSLDLTGLPPAPASVDAFVADPAPDAYEKFVDQLLKSPQWGEHRGRYWLDAARYADTHGIHFDNYREVWAYRDWVIDAFNRNLPFDQFTIEQLAGDLLPDRTLDQQIASGFNRCNITTNEGGAIGEEYLVLYTRDRTETTSQVWLGLTAGCAVCHDHKFDPLSQKEFYELAAFFNNTTQNAMDGNIKDTPPKVFVPAAADRPRWDPLVGEIAAAKQLVESRKQDARMDFDTWLKELTPETSAGLVAGETLHLHLPLNEGTQDGLDTTILSATMEGQSTELLLPAAIAWETGHVAQHAYKSQAGQVIELPAAGDFEKDQAFSCGVWVKTSKNSQNGALVARMDDQNDFRGWDLWMENGRIGSHIIHHWQEDALKVVSKNPVKAGEWNHLVMTYDGSGKAAGVKIYVNGVSQETNVTADALKGTIRTTVPLKIAQRHTTSRLDETSMGDLRIYHRVLSGPETQQLALATRAQYLASKTAEQRGEAENNELFQWWLPALDQPFQELSTQLGGLEQEQARIQTRGTIAHVMQERREPAIAHILFRGEYDQRREQVAAGTPQFLPPLSAEFPQNRLGFAQWLLQPEHPLTSRVTVNRFWQEVFGTGLVRTAGDFGVSGELPSHPELLDWLAVEFRESGWDMKAFFQLLVTSATYRQSAVVTADKLEKDAENILLSRGPRFRMDAEVIRDYALAASGLLSSTIGGPSVKPYQPEGVWEAVAMIGSNTRDYRADSGEKLYRRSLYTFWKRSAPPASMDIFNAPSREVCTVRRERTNTPLQALVTLNDPQFIEAARHLAQVALHEAEPAAELTVESRLELLAKRLLARPLRPAELQIVQETLNDLIGHYRENEEDTKRLLTVGQTPADPALDAATLAGWTMLVNQLMNLDEVLNK